MRKIAVIGGGTAGIAASINLADAGHKVFLISDSPFIGGTIPQLDKQFPNDACGFCQLYSRTQKMKTELCLKRNFGIDNVEMITDAEVVSISEDRKKLKLKKRPEYVKVERCIACGKCAEVCPLEKQSEFNLLSKRKAIYTPYPFAVPNTYVIDGSLCDKCGKCVEVCPTDAIDLSAKEKNIEIEVDDIMITTGFKPYDPSELSEFGYARFKNVITSIELERLISEFGPNYGKLERPSDKKHPEKIGIIHCIGSRDRKHPYCSSACCMYAVKEARMLKRMNPETELALFYMDMRDFGKRYFLYRKEIEGDVRYIRSRPAFIEENPENNNLILYYEDEEGNMKNEEFDLVVLSIGQDATDTMKLTEKLGLKTNYSFIEPADYLHPFRAGEFYAAGSSTGPKDLPDTVVEAWAAAGYIETGSVEELDIEKVSSIGNSLKIGVVLSKSAKELSFDADRIREEINKNNASFKEIEYLTVPEGLNELVDFIKEENLDRLIILGPPLFSFKNIVMKKIAEIGWHPSQVVMHEIDGDSDVTDVIVGTALGEINRMKYITYESETEFMPEKRVLIIGGGLTGLETAFSLSRSGIEVTIVEKESQLGGNALTLRNTLEGAEVASYTENLIKKIEEDPGVEVIKNSEVKELQGWAGDFTILIDENGKDREIKAGAIVVATGGYEYKPDKGEFGFGLADNVVSLKTFEKLIEEGRVKKGERVVFIQCVGSRNDKHPYCSRVCCRAAVRNSLKLIEQGLDVTVLARDVMTWGLAELYYKKAREKGVVFIHYKEDKPPVVEDGKVKVYDRIMDAELIFEPDWIVLSAGISPNPDNEKLASVLGIPVDQYGFFKEANVKFRPIESQKEGIYVAGLSRGPRRSPEAISDAYAVVSRVLPLIKKKLMTPRLSVSKTNKRRCSICGICVDVCPSGARILDLKQRYARVNEAICQGCGICTTACPSGAAFLVSMNRKQIFGIIDGVLSVIK